MRAKRKDVDISHVDIVLTNGVSWRIDPNAQLVYEIENRGPLTEVRGPVSIDHFIDLAKAVQARKSKQA